MNKTYRVVWNEHTNTWTVLQETAKARGKSGNRISKALALSVSLFGFYAASSTVAYAQPGIYMNDYQDTGCAASYDQVEKTGVYGLLGNMPPSTETYNNGQANKTHHSDFGIKTGFNPCSPTGNSAQNFDTQTNRTLFYGDATFGYAIDEKNAGSKHLTLGGRLDVNSGIIGVGNKGVNGVGATNSIRMGSGTSLDATNDADKAITIGVNSGATAKNATAIGHGTKAGGQNAFAAGLDTHADNENTVAIGTNANASGKTSTAIGQGAKASHQSATALGDGAKALNDYATALGVTANASEAGALAVGMTSAASAWNSAAIGSNASASGSTSLAAGYKASAGSSNSLAVGSSAKATATDASAYGHIATAKGISASAFGHGANAEKDHTVAVGSAAQATELGAIAIGNDAQATASDALANGKNSRALGERATAVGNSARANNQDSVAVGNGAQASADYAFAAGTGSVAKAAGAVALGNDAKANHEGAVALGRASETAAAVGTSSATVNGISYSGFAGDAPDSTVSVGSDSLKRTVTNVAAGRINATSTDAINGSQLYLVAEKIGALQAGQTHYYSVKSGQTGADTNYANDGATGADSLAAGVKAVANKANAVAVGSDVTASGEESLAVGNLVKADGKGATAIGNNSKATAEGAQAFGQSSEARKKNSAAIGRLSIADGERAAAFGVGNTASGASSLSVGDKSVASESNAAAIGTEAKAVGKNSIAAGYKANAANDGAVAIGANTSATNASTALGDGSKATGQNATALGWNANAAGRADVFIGKQAGLNTGNTNNNSNIGIGEGAVRNVGNAVAVDNVIGIGTGAAEGIQGKHNIALGAYANGTGSGNAAVATDNNVAIGQRAYANAGNSIAVGNRTQATGAAAIALGVAANASAAQSLAAGQNTVASASGTVAIGGSANAGNGAAATGVQAIAIGQQSVADKLGALALGKGAKSTHANSVALGSDSTSTATFGTVSNVSVNGITYTGFAADTVASTVSVGSAGGERAITNVGAGRINATSTDAINGSQLYLTQAAIGNVGTTIKNILGGNAALGTDGKLSMTNIGGTGKNTIHEAIQAANNNANAANAGFKIKADDDAAGITADNKTIKPSETLTIKGTGSLNAGKLFADDYNSDNIRTQVSGDGTVTIGLKRDLDVNSVTATDAAGNKTVTNAAGTTVTNAAGNSTSVGANGVVITPPAGSSKNAVALTGNGLNNGNNTITGVKNGVAPTDAVNVSQLDAVKAMAKAAKTEVTSSDNSISITPSTNAATGATVYDLAVKTDGTTITKTADGSLKANTTALTPAANGSIVAPTAADAGKLATAGDIANAINQAGFNLTTTASAGNVSGSSVERVNAGKTVTIDAGKNIRVTQNGNTVSIATQDNASFDSVTTGNTKIDNNGLTINGGPSVTQAGIDAAGNKITNVAAGTDPTDAVNVSQLNARLGATGQVAAAKLQQLEDKIDKNQDRANAGIAGAIAQGTIPQVTRPSAFGLGVGTGYYGGQSALAVGASAMTDGGNWIFKGNVSVNSKGRVGAGAGALFQW